MTPEIKRRIEQIRRGEVPEGYKRSTDRIIPNDWYDYQLGDVGEVLMCKRVYANQTSEVGEIPFYKIGTFGKAADAFISRQLYEDYRRKYSYPQKGDILISAAGTLGKTVIYDGQEAYFQDSNIVWLKTDDRKLSNKYLIHYYQIINWPTPEGAAIQRLYNGIIREAHIVAPAVSEQQKIAAILTTQDKVIELKEKRLAEKLRQKKYLMQQLLTGKKRLPGFNIAWKKTKLKNILHERKTYSPKGLEYPHVTLSTEGIFPKSDRYDRDHLVKDEYKEYKITHKGDICYNPANLKFGVICENTFEDAIFSPIYVTFEVNQNVCKEYLANYLMRWDFINAVRKYEEGTVYERMAVKPEDFLKFEILLPHIDEQTAIAQVLSTADREISLLRQDIEQEKQKKKALMQLLLTGIVRVNV